jgi:hypothetical protein
MPLLTGKIRDFDASLGNGAAAAMLVDVEASEPGAATITGPQTILTTTSAGQTWEPPVLPEVSAQISTSQAGVTVIGGVVMDRITVNPTRPNEAWLYGEEGIYYLNETGLSQVTSDPTRVLDVALQGGAVVAYDRGPTGRVSFDNGASFQPFSTGLPVESADAVLSAPLSVATGAAGRLLYQYWGPGQKSPVVIDASPADGRAIADVQVAFPESTQRPSVFARTLDTIEVTFEPKGDPLDTSLPEIVLQAPDPLKAANELIPSYKRLVLGVGESRTVPYALDLPAATTPLDVYFLIDISSSMQGAIDGIKTGMQEIIDRLYEQKIDVQFGVGAYRAYTDPPAYDRVRQIGPMASDLGAALSSLRAAGGGAETQMAALLQSVTGEGDAVIPPGLEMRFRPGSLRVAIEVTDEPISQGGNHPTFDQVIDALVQHDVKQVALAVEEPPLLGDFDYDRPGEPATDLMNVARGSKAVVPQGSSVDCDGDTDADLQAGDPIVCLVDPNRASDSALMAEAIVNVLNAIEDVRSLEVVASPTTDPTASSPVVDSIEPQVLPAVDLKKPHHLEFNVTARCPLVTRRTLFPVNVAVERSTTPLGDGTLEVMCVPPPAPKEPPPLLPAIVPIAAVPPPPPRPPEPIPEPNPNPQPNPQHNPQAQAGFAAQEQQQPQLALAGQEGVAPDVAEEGAQSDEFMASSHQESRVPPVAFIFTTAAMTSAFGYVLVTRNRTRTAHASRRR